MHQKGIFHEDSQHFHYLEFNCGGDPKALASAVKKGLSLDRDEVFLVVGFGPRLCRTFLGERTPPGLHDFKELKAHGHKLPSTQADLLIWIHGKDRGRVFRQALNLSSVFRESCELHLDESGFTYLDSRDLTGFIDGTANPKGDDRLKAAVLQEEVGSGGSFAMTQKWVHNLEDFHKLDQKEQESIIGRTKEESIELQGESMPANSHVSRTDLVKDGKPIKIYRRSTPFGSVEENGLMFLAFSKSIDSFNAILSSMIGANSEIHDRILGVSKAVTGSYWYCPTVADLETII